MTLKLKLLSAAACILTACLCASVLIGSSASEINEYESASGAEHEDNFDPVPIYGDVNSDQKVTASDARLILRFSARLIMLSGRQVTLGDADLNGKTNAADARLILRTAAGLETLRACLEPITNESMMFSSYDSGEAPTQTSESTVIPYPSDTSEWELICVNRFRSVSSSAENKIKLSYVAGSAERMDSRAAAAYEKMYDAAAADGIYLTPCSGYRSYSTQKRLFEQLLYGYMNGGYSYDSAYRLASTRRNPPGSSEHNLGICMDIICASSAANFENTAAYAWLDKNAHNFGFILRYPEDKTDITGVKFEPWHWRYVGVGNALAIKTSGLCLEEYLSIAR